MMSKLSREWGAAVDLKLSMITRPVERLVATAQNGLEVLRLGGLETGTVASHHRSSRACRCTSCGGTFRPTAVAGSAGRSAGAAGAPDDNIGRHVGRHS